MNWHFRTIGMGSINYRKAAQRLASEAENTELFASSNSFTETDLRKLMPDFWKNHSNVLHPRVPGFGWWVWKPHFILNQLLSLPEGDGLLYLDAGSVIKNDPPSINVIKSFMQIAKSSHVLGSNSDFYSEELYCSEDLMSYMNLNSNQRTESQYCAAIVFLVNDTEGREFAKKWSLLVCEDNHRWLLPRDFALSNHKNFKHHMHDQASFSCLMKSTTNLSIVTGNHSSDGAIRLARHRYAYSYLERRMYIKLFYKGLNFFSKIQLALQRRIYRDSLYAPPQNHLLNIQ